MEWIRPVARPFLEPDADVFPAEALRVLERELNAPRRFAGGTAAVALLLLAGLTATLAAALVGEADGAVLVVGMGAFALLLGGVAVWIGLSVIDAGRRVVGAYRAWSDTDSGTGTGPAALIDRALAGPWLLREILAAATFLATVFAAALVVLPFTGTIEDFVAAGLGIGGTALVGFGTATWCLLSTDFRAGWAHSRRVGRGHQRRGRG